MRTHVVYQIAVPVCVGLINSENGFMKRVTSTKFRFKQKLKHDGQAKYQYII